MYHATFKDEVDCETDHVQLANIVWTVTDDNSSDSNSDVTKHELLLTSMDLLNCVEDIFFSSSEKEWNDDQAYDYNGNDDTNCNDYFAAGNYYAPLADDYGEEEETACNDSILSSFKVLIECDDSLQQCARTYWNDDFDHD